MAKKSTTRNKKPKAAVRKSKASRASSSAAKSRSAKKTKSTTKNKAKSTVARQSAAGAKSRKTTSKKKAVSKKKSASSTSRKPAKKTTRKKAATTRKTTTKKKASTPAKSKARKAGASRASVAGTSKKTAAATPRSGKSHSTLTTPERKPGMLDPMPAHPNDAAHERSTPARLTRKQLNHFRDLLLKRRAELIGDVQAMESGALRGGGSGDSGHAPMHMADAGSDTFDQEFALQLAATERELLEEIDKSLENIKNGTFGVCEVTGKPISLPRLEAKPWAKVCIEVARERDRFHRFRH